MQGRTLYIGNMSKTLRRDTISELFSAHGTVLDVKILGNNAFGFVEMSSQEEAETAKNALNGHEVEGARLKVDEARPKKYKRSGRY